MMNPNDEDDDTPEMWAVEWMDRGLRRVTVWEHHCEARWHWLDVTETTFADLRPATKGEIDDYLNP